MKSKIDLTRKDVFVAFCCTLFLLATLGAVGSRGRRRAKEAVCAANLKRWGVIFRTFAADNGGFFMARAPTVEWVETLASYYENRRLLLCPEARKTFFEGGRNPFMAWPFNHHPGEPKGSYGINLWVANSDSAGTEHTGGIIDYWKTPYVAGAGDAPVLIDAQFGNMQPYAFDEPSPFENDLWTVGPINEIRRACISRHNGGVNTVFLDGSVRKVGLKHLWTIHWHRVWEEELDQVGFPVWPQWMANFKDPP